MTKTNTRKTATATPDVMAMIHALTEQIAGLTAIVTATPAPATPDVTATPAKARKAKALTPAKAKEQAARKAKADSIKQARETGANMPYAQALTLAAARIVHNKVQALKADKNASHINAAIFGTSPNSVRVWLTSAEHQAYKASRDAAGVNATDSETNLVQAIAKVSKAKK